jgi:hypothetical protein
MSQSNEVGRFCQSCGEKHEALAAYCPSCGRELNKVEAPKEVASPVSVDGQGKTPSRSRKLISIGTPIFGAAVLVAGSLFFFGGGGQIREVLGIETVADCLAEGNHGALANKTTSLIREMGSSLNVASAIGTREALVRAGEGLNTNYGPAFSGIALEWKNTDDCGDEKLASYNNDLASELSSIGLIFTSFDVGDTAALERAAVNMTNITDITDDLARHIGSL